MKKLDSITVNMMHEYCEQYRGVQTIDVYQNHDGSICISGVFGCSKDYPTIDARAKRYPASPRIHSYPRGFKNHAIPETNSQLHRQHSS